MIGLSLFKHDSANASIIQDDSQSVHQSPITQGDHQSHVVQDTKNHQKSGTLGLLSAVVPDSIGIVRLVLWEGERTSVPKRKGGQIRERSSL